MSKRNKKNAGQGEATGEPKVRKARGPLSPEQKDAMQAARKVAKVQVEDGLKLVAENGQLTNPKFWAKVDSDKVAAIEKAIRRAAKIARKSEISTLEAKLASLRADAGETA